jgi:hypothetical protein
MSAIKSSEWKLFNGSKTITQDVMNSEWDKTDKLKKLKTKLALLERKIQATLEATHEDEEN